VTIAVIVVVLYTSIIFVSASALDMWADILTFKEKVAEANKIMRVSFFLITV